MKIGIIDAGLLPEVGEGINGSPVVAPLDCPEGGEGMKIAVTPDAGPGYMLNPNGSSCYGTDRAAPYNALETDFSAGNGKNDHPAFPPWASRRSARSTAPPSTSSHPSRGTASGRSTWSLTDYQKGGQDFIAGWNPETGQCSPGFPAVDNDLSFITGRRSGTITGEAPGQEVVGGHRLARPRGVQRGRGCPRAARGRS